jgi:YbbR domain-containing protein
MREWLAEVFLSNWQKKLVALFTATFIYLLINNAITTTRTIANVPVRILDLPQDKTVEGLLPSGILSERVTLTLTGSKNIIDELEPGDLEVFLDASSKTGQWVANIGR